MPIPPVVDILDPDSIYIDGMEGGTGAGPHLATEDTGVPGMAAIRQARKAIDDLGKRGEISLVYAGGIRNGADMTVRAPGGDHHVVGNGRLPSEFYSNDVIRLGIVQYLDDLA